MFEQSSPGVFQRTTLLSSTGLLPSGFVAADFNGDGYYDLAGRTGTKQGNVYLNQQDSTFITGPAFSYSNIAVGSYPTAPRYGAGDFNEDGYIDLAISSYACAVTGCTQQGEIYTLNGDGNGNLATPVQVATTPQEGGATIVGFFDGDSHLDIISGQDDDGDAGQAWVYFGDGTGSFVDNDDEAYDTNPSNEGGSNNPGGGHGQPFHLDGDGFLDLIVVYSTGSSYAIAYWSGNGDGSFNKVEDINVKAHESRFALPPTPANTGVPLLDRMLFSAWPECPFCGTQEAVGQGGGPINTRNGNLSYQETDISVPILGGNLSFRRAYASQAISIYTGMLGYGWTHNYDMKLHFSDNALSDTIELQAPGGSRLPFFCSSSCISHQEVYTPYAGVTASLSRITVTNPVTTHYIITSFNQMTYTFNHAGLLLQQADAAGNTVTFTHNITGQLIKAAQNGRYLNYDYNEDGRLVVVNDNTGREILLDYNEFGDLITVTNTLGVATLYEYDFIDQKTPLHLLIKVTDPSGRIVEETAYDSEGRAYRQLDGLGNVIVELDFTISNTHIMTENGVVFTHTYDARGTLVETTFACKDNIAGCQTSHDTGYDYNFKTDQVVDANDNPTSLDWNAGGSNLEGVTDAMGNSTSLGYDGFNNLTQVVNARSHTTTYAYDNANFPTFRTAVTNALEQTTIYTPTTAALDGVDGLLKAQRDPNGVVISYTYNTFGQVIQMVHGYGTTDAVTTTYGYDSIGRLITTTQTSVLESHTTLNVYDNGDRLRATISNWTGSDPAQWLSDCDTSGGERDTNVCTRYKYDDAGRTISSTNTLNQTNLTFYDDAGRVVTSVVNYDGTTPFSQLCTDFTDPDPEYNICSLTGYDEFGRVVTTTNSLGHESVTEYNAAGRVSRTIQNYDDGVFNANEPDTDIETLYEYDNAGNTIIITDTLGRMNRSFYDELNRVKGTVINWRGEAVSPITSTATLSNCFTLPENRDYDVCTLYRYDEVGNTIMVTDTLTHTTRTFYDELNRVVGTVANWRGEQTSTITSIATLSNCFTLPENRDYDICTLYGYDDAGNQITVTNALNQMSLTVYDEANRPVIQVANWDGSTAISADGTGCANTETNPTAEENLCTSIASFDQLGRRAAYTDTMGLLTTFVYDGLGRVVTTTRYLGSQPANTVTSYDALGNRLSQTDALTHTTTYTYDSLNRVIVTTSPEGVAITQTYNAAGWVITTTDSLGRSTVNEYDDLGRLISTTDAEGNQTQYEYDALGNQTAMIDAENVKTVYVYDELNQLVKVIENYVDGTPNGNEEDVTTEYDYDAAGNRLLVINAKNITFTQTLYDGLYRPVVITDAIDNETHYVYDALGSRVVTTDGNNAVTQYTYDDLNRLRVTAYLSDSETVSYTYDAVGNRLVMTDSLGVTSYEYDGFYRLISVTNPFNEAVQYNYDLVGNRTHLTYPDSKMVIYTYDDDNRLVEVEDWDTGLTTYGYDPAGRLVTTTLPNGVETIYGYDDANRLLSLVQHDESGLLLARFLYRLDGVGNRVVVSETLATLGVGGLAALPGVQDNLLVEYEGPVTAEIVLTTVTGAGTAESSRPIAQAKPTLYATGIPYPWSMNAAELAAVPREQTGEAAELTIRLARIRLTADGRDGTHIVVLATDGNGRPVADGTRINFQTTGGQVRPATATTTNGLIFAWLAAGQQTGPGQVLVSSGILSETVDFTLSAPSPGSLRVDEPAETPPEQLPFDLAEVVERARNTIEAPEGRPPFIERPGHLAVFDAGELRFTPQGEVTTAVPLTLAFQLAKVSIGEVSLFTGPATATVSLNGNIAHLERGQNLVEEFVARDGGIEQQWQIMADPGLSGDLAIAVEVETALELAYAPGGEGFSFRATDPGTGEVFDAAGYGRAIALDAGGRAKRAWLSAEELEPSLNGLNRYRLTMTIPAGWLAEASYPVLVDPLIGGLIHVESAIQDEAQSRPAVAYDSNNDQYLVVWQDNRNGHDADIYGQLVTADGLLNDVNFEIYADSGDQIVPDIAFNPDESVYLVVWQDEETDTILGQLLDENGQIAWSGEYLDLDEENTTDGSDNPAVTYSSAEQVWLVTWQGLVGSANAVHIIARAVDGDSDGSMQDTFIVYEPPDDATAPDVAANDSGGFLVAWEQIVDEFQNNQDIYLRRVISTAVDGAVFYTSTIGTQTAPTLVYNQDDDQYLLVWQDLDEYGFFGYDAIWARAVKGVTDTIQFAGNPFRVSGSELADSASPAVTYFNPSAASGGNGLYLVAWQQTITGGALNLQAQLVMTDSTLSGSTLALSSADNDQADVALGFGPVVTNTLAAWTDERGGTADVYAKLMGPDGVMGSGFKVHPVTGDQINPQAAYNPDDDEYLVVWQDYRNGAGNPDIYAQRISGAGILAGDNFTITESVNEELAPEVAYGSGVYLVAWRYKVGLEFGDAYAQIISPTGELAGSSFVIMNGNHTQQPTDIIYNPDLGKFFVLWKDSRTAFWDTWGRHVSPNGTMGTAIQITSVNDHHEVNAEGAYNPEEQQYLVVWEDGPAGSNRDILARRILISETVVTTETISIAATGSDEREADVVYLPASGRYAVVWREGSTGDILGRLVTPDGAVDGSAFTISDNANDERMPRIAEDGLGGAIVVWWRDNGSGQKDLYGRQLDPNGQLLESTFTILEQGDVQDKPAVVGAGGGQYLIAWQDDRNGSWDIYASLYQQEHSHSTVITYTYDPLYRLTEAVYAGAITATYEYQYDPVGNMTGYTTTITSTTVVTRTFNDANQLAVSGDGSGNTTYVYDGNGNLVSQIEPEGVDLRTYVYAYDQRNLLVSTHWYRTNYTGPRTDYDYDGSGNRLREWEYAGAQTPPPNPDRIITYTNDILGLSQVLIADDGTEQVVNLFGLDLIHQNGSTEIRTLLADGLGSVRLEMTDDGVETTTTYSPYGDTLTQSGTSGTVYGFTGEQEGSTTGLLYLRARYYNSYLNQFQSRDPFPGQNRLPQSQNGYSYVNNNPINYTDPSGLCAENGDESCWALAEQAWRAGLGTLNDLGALTEQELRDLLDEPTLRALLGEPNSRFDQVDTLLLFRGEAVVIDATAYPLALASQVYQYNQLTSGYIRSSTGYLNEIGGFYPRGTIVRTPKYPRLGTAFTWGLPVVNGGIYYIEIQQEYNAGRITNEQRWQEHGVNGAFVVGAGAAGTGLAALGAAASAPAWLIGGAGVILAFDLTLAQEMANNVIEGQTLCEAFFNARETTISIYSLGLLD